MIKTIYGVAYIHFGLGIGLSVLLFYCLDFLLGTNLVNFFCYTPQGIWLVNVFGVFAVALAIKDGEFIDHVKKSHWTQKEKNKSE